VQDDLGAAFQAISELKHQVLSMKKANANLIRELQQSIEVFLNKKKYFIQLEFYYLITAGAERIF
jgi:hypothetical protein